MRKLYSLLARLWLARLRLARLRLARLRLARLRLARLRLARLRLARLWLASRVNNPPDEASTGTTIAGIETGCRGRAATRELLTTVTTTVEA